MYIQLVREGFTDKATEGKMFVNGTFECYTLEDTDRHLEDSIDGSEKIYGRTAIPRGTYDIELSYSNHFSKILPHIKDVPYFEGVRIHSGNSDKDTEGCILVGKINTSDTDDWVGQSRAAFNSLFPKIETAIANNEEVTIEIV